MDAIIRKSQIDGVAAPPSSKSYTHRAFFAASLSCHSLIKNPLFADDTLSTLQACKKMGAFYVRNRDFIYFTGTGHINRGYFYCGNSGTTLRILMGITAASTDWKPAVLDGDESLRKRPSLELIKALNSLGAVVNGNLPPVRVSGTLKGGEVVLEATSSQFLTSLLMSLPLAKTDSAIKVRGLKSKPYVNVTLHVLQQAGVQVEKEGDIFYVESEQDYRLTEFFIPSDFSSAGYLISAGLLAGKVEITGMFDSEQGDRRIVEIAREMGGKVRWDKERGVITAAQSELEGIEVDCSDTPDLAPTIAVLGAVAKGKTAIVNAPHLRVKEVDRIRGVVKNLRRLGVQVKELPDGFEIRGGAVKGGIVDSLGDHRLAMAFSLLGLVAEKEIIVKNCEAVSVSFPKYYDVLKKIGADIQFRPV
jgi:3-phosphoshikimate 1-carboxyvinyltransferase